MLLGRTTIQDKKTGNRYEMAKVLVAVGDGTRQERLVPYDRYREISDALQFQAAMWPTEKLKKMMDSTDPIAFFVSQLAYTEARMVARQRVPQFWRDLVPVSNEAPPWAETVEYQTFDQVMAGKRIAANGTDIPLVDVKLGRKIIEVASGGLGYAYNLQELIASQQLKQPLSDLRMSAVNTGYNVHMNLVALWGEQNFGGLFNSSSVTPVQATTGAWDNSSTDPKAILQDLNDGITAVLQKSGTNTAVNKIAMPLTALSALNGRILTVTASDGSSNVAGGISVLKYLKENNLSKLSRGIDIEFVGIPKDPESKGYDLDSVGTVSHAGGATTGKSRVVYYAKDEDCMVMHIPQQLQFLAPQLERLSVVVPGHYRYAGLEIRRPNTVYYQDSVLKADV